MWKTRLLEQEMRPAFEGKWRVEAESTSFEERRQHWQYAFVRQRYRLEQRRNVIAQRSRCSPDEIGELDIANLEQTDWRSILERGVTPDHLRLFSNDPAVLTIWAVPSKRGKPNLVLDHAELGAAHWPRYWRFDDLGLQLLMESTTMFYIPPTSLYHEIAYPSRVDLWPRSLRWEFPSDCELPAYERGYRTIVTTLPGMPEPQPELPMQEIVSSMAEQEDRYPDAQGWLQVELVDGDNPGVYLVFLMLSGGMAGVGYYDFHHEMIVWNDDHTFLGETNVRRWNMIDTLMTEIATELTHDWERSVVMYREPYWPVSYLQSPRADFAPSPLIELPPHSWLVLPVDAPRWEPHLGGDSYWQ